MGKSPGLPITDDNGWTRVMVPLAEAAKKRGYTELSRQTGIPATHFYRLFSPEYGNPSLGSVAKIARALGFELALSDPDKPACSAKPSSPA